MNRTPKAQIGIFIVISILIIVLFTFLLNYNFNIKNQNLKKTNSISKITSQSKLFPLSDNVDFCLSLELKKALIISGARGGFIYNNGEYYSPSINFNKLYSPKLISNLDISWDYFGQQVLISGQDLVYSPSITTGLKSNGIIIYNNSISKEFKYYILSNFLNCINLKRYKKAGYIIKRNNFSGNIKSINREKIIEITNVKWKIGDKTLLIFNGKFYFGNVTKIIKPITYIELQDKLNPGNIKISNFVVNNLNSSTFIKLKFNRNSVSASINFPITISKGNFSTSFLTSTIKVNSRFKTLLNFGNNLITKKYGQPTSNIFNKSYLKTLNPKSISLLGFNISRTIINNSGSYKLYVYSLIDNQSMLFGTPFVFNFAYEDSAPYLTPDIKPKKLLNSYKGNLNFVTAVNDKFNPSLKKYIKDKEALGNLNYYCIPNSINTERYTFRIFQNCTVNFYSTKKGFDSFKIYLTDGFVKRTQTISFFTGFEDNKNNTEAKDCFKFTNYNFPSFPLSYTYENKIFNSTTPQGKEELFGYFLNNVINQTPNTNTSNLKFLSSCSYNSQYTIKYKENGGTWKNFPSSGFNTKNNEKSKIQLQVNIFNSGNLKMIENDYKITLYPVGCLGPDKLNSTNQEIFGGYGSCCKLTSLPTNNPPQNNNKKMIKNILSNGNALNANFYLTYIFGNHYSKFNYTDNNFWAKYGKNATSLYEGKITAQCGGKYPEVSANIKSIKQITSLNIKEFTVKQIFNNLDNITLKSPLHISLNQINVGGICHFNAYGNNSDFGIILNNGFALTAGIMKNNILFKNQHLSTINSKKFGWFKCGSGYVDSNFSKIWSDISIGFGKNSYNSKIFVSEKFCAPLSFKCTGNILSPNEKQASDNLAFCKNTFINNTNPSFFDTINTPDGTICGKTQIPITTICLIKNGSCINGRYCKTNKNGKTCTITDYKTVNETCNSGTCKYP